MGNCIGHCVHRNQVREKKGSNRSGYKFMQLQEYGDGGVRQRPILPRAEQRARERRRSPVQQFTEHNIDIVHDLNIQRPAQPDLVLQGNKLNFNHRIPSQGGEVRRVKVLISSRELSEMLHRDNGEEGIDIGSVLFQKLRSGGNCVSFNGRRCHSSGQSWKPSLADIPEVVSW